MHKSFKLMMALIIGLFTVPMMGSPVFADDSYDNIADGEYDIGVTALEDGSDKESIADDFVHDATLSIDNGNPSLTLGIGADGGDYANFDFSINWVQVEGKKPSSESEEGDLIYYTFQLDSVKTKVPAQMEYVVPDFPPLADGHEVAFDLELSGLDELPEKAEQGDVTVTYVDQDGEEVAETEILKGDIGDSYAASQKEVDGYDFVKVNGDEKGEFSEKTVSVEYVYEKEEEETEVAPEEREVGELITKDEADAVYELKYETESQATSGILENPVQLLEKDDEEYIQIPINEDSAQFFRSLKIDGKEVTWNSITEGPYTIQFELPNGIEDELDLSMVIQAGQKVMSHNVKLSFDEESLETIKEPEEPEEQGKVTVTYVDQGGEKVADTETLKGDIGDSYAASQKEVDGYDFVKANGDEIGEFAGETATVEYVYREQEEEVEQGDVKVTYVDQDGKEVADTETLKGDIGDSYAASQKEVDGYDFVKVNGDETGEYDEETATVEYVYEKQEKENGNGHGIVKGNGDEGEVNPETGDNSNILLNFLLLIGSGVPLAFIVKRRFA